MIIMFIMQCSAVVHLRSFVLLYITVYMETTYLFRASFTILDALRLYSQHIFGQIRPSP